MKALKAYFFPVLMLLVLVAVVVLLMHSLGGALSPRSLGRDFAEIRREFAAGWQEVSEERHTNRVDTATNAVSMGVSEPDGPVMAEATVVIPLSATHICEYPVARKTVTVKQPPYPERMWIYTWPGKTVACEVPGTNSHDGVFCVKWDGSDYVVIWEPCE